MLFTVNERVKKTQKEINFINKTNNTKAINDEMNREEKKKNAEYNLNTKN